MAATDCLAQPAPLAIPSVPGCFNLAPCIWRATDRMLGPTGSNVRQAKQNPPGIPGSSVDTNKITKIEFVGPESDHPNKTVIPNDANNFGPAVGFAWTLPWFGAGKTTIRGGYQVTFGGAGLRTAGGLENTLGNIPGNSSTATLNRADIPDPVLSLANFTTLIPVKPTAPAVPGGDVPIYNHNSNFTAYDPTYEIGK